MPPRGVVNIPVQCGAVLQQRLDYTFLFDTKQGTAQSWLSFSKLYTFELMLTYMPVFGFQFMKVGGPTERA